jgi:hypothetical protein
MAEEIKIKKEEPAEWTTTANVDDSDQIVDEFDVFMTPTLAKEVAIFQFPIRSFLRPFSFRSDLTELKGKSFHKSDPKIEMHLKTKKKSEYYDDSATQLATAHKMVLNSTKVPLKTNYCVGVFKGGNLLYYFLSLQRGITFDSSVQLLSIKTRFWIFG